MRKRRKRRKRKLEMSCGDGQQNRGFDVLLCTLQPSNARDFILTPSRWRPMLCCNKCRGPPQTATEWSSEESRSFIAKLPNARLQYGPSTVNGGTYGQRDGGSRGCKGLCTGRDVADEFPWRVLKRV